MIIFTSYGAYLFFFGLIQDWIRLIQLVRLAITTITTTIINNRGIGSYFNLEVFLATKIIIYWLIAIGIINITF